MKKKVKASRKKQKAEEGSEVQTHLPGQGKDTPSLWEKEFSITLIWKVWLQEIEFPTIMIQPKMAWLLIGMMGALEIGLKSFCLLQTQGL